MTTATRPPGPKGRWPLGSLLEFRRNNLAFYERCAREFGDVAFYRFGPKQIYQVNHPDLVEYVLVSGNRHFTKNFAIRILDPVLGNGLVSSEGNFWLRQRKLMQPAFLRPRLASYGPLMVAATERLLATWQDGQPRALHADMMQLTLQIAAEVLFGADVPADAVQIVAASAEIIQGYFADRFEGLLPVPRWLPTPGNRRLKRAVRRLDEIVYGFIKQRRAGGEDRGDLLSILLRARDEDDGSRMTDRQLRDEVMTLFLAGHETTALALSWAWYLLARHPDVEAKLLAELHAVLGGRTPTAADVPRLRYAEHVMLETMRLYPPVYAFGREAAEECELGGWRVPVGANVFLVQWTMHRDPRWFPEPARFDPDRWADGLVQRIPKYAYFPFGGGPRVCIGNTFALMEAVLVLATILPRFHITLDPAHPVTPWPSITLRPRYGIKATVHRRP